MIEIGFLMISFRKINISTFNGNVSILKTKRNVSKRIWVGNAKLRSKSRSTVSIYGIVAAKKKNSPFELV